MSLFQFWEKKKEKPQKGTRGKSLPILSGKQSNILLPSGDSLRQGREALLSQSSNQNNKSEAEPTNRKEEYGRAWLRIIRHEKTEEAIRVFRVLDSIGFIEATIALAMFCEDQEERKTLIKKAADKGHPEGLWQYCSILPHSFIPDPNNMEDALWEKTCLEAAESGSVDAMNEMGNVFHRRGHFAEAMYWYAMATVNDYPDGLLEMQGVADEWVQAGSPGFEHHYPLYQCDIQGRASEYVKVGDHWEFVKGSDTFTLERYNCALDYLKIMANITGIEKLEENWHFHFESVKEGVLLAGYVVGEIFINEGAFDVAEYFYEELTELKFAHGMKRLADFMLLGKGTIKNIPRAIQLYNDSANAGDREAMIICGDICKITGNLNEAAYWYGVAYSRGEKEALDRLFQLTQWG